MFEVSRSKCSRFRGQSVRGFEVKVFEVSRSKCSRFAYKGVLLRVVLEASRLRRSRCCWKYRWRARHFLFLLAPRTSKVTQNNTSDIINDPSPIPKKMPNTGAPDEKVLRVESS